MRLVLLLAALLAVAVPAHAINPLDDDAGSGRDAGDDGGVPVAILPDVGYQGRVTRGIDMADHYALEAQQGQVLVASQLLDVTFADGSQSVADGDCEFAAAPLDGAVDLAMRHRGGLLSQPALDYDLRVALVDVPVPNDAGSGRDAGNWTDALELPDGSSAGYYGFGDKADAYRFPVRDGERFTLELVPPPRDLSGFYQPGFDNVIHNLGEGPRSHVAHGDGHVIVTIHNSCFGTAYTLALTRG